jgi:hypothetical protein
MLPQASGQNLVYAGATSGDAVYAFSYATGALLGKITSPAGTIAIEDLCSDKSGYLYVTTLSSKLEGLMYKYAHGTSGQPIETYHLAYGVAPVGCAVDPRSGDIAVAGRALHNGYLSGIAVFQPGGTYEGRGYYNYTISNYYYCGYDDKGNLFVNGQGAGNEMYLAELRKGATTLTNISLSKTISLSGMGQIQWDGHAMTVEDLTNSAIYRFQVSGTKATVTGTTRLYGWNFPTLSSIQGSTLVIPTGSSGGSVGYWKYPGGGKATRLVKAPAGLRAVAISLAPQQ